MSIYDGYPYSNQHELNLDWVLQHIREYQSIIDNTLPGYEAEVQALRQAVSALSEDVGSLSGGRLEQTVTAILAERLAKMIFVEINRAGYIVYNIPDGWEDIVFHTTGKDINLEIEPEYGHLVLSY